MTPSHAPERGLVVQLRAWRPEQVAALLVRRPDLATPKSPVDLEELAQRAQTHASITAAIATTTLPENRLLQVVVCCPPDVTMEELGAALPDGVSLDAVEPVLDSLEAAGLVWRHDGRLHTSPMLRRAMPTRLGEAADVLLGAQTVDYLKHVIAKITAVVAPSMAFQLPSAVLGKGNTPRKAELVDHLVALLLTPGVVDGVLRAAPEEAAELAHLMAAGPPIIEVDRPLYVSHYMADYNRRLPTFWLFEHGLLLPAADREWATMPREVGLALRGGRPVADLALSEPVLAIGTADRAAVEAEASRSALATLDHLSDIVDRWSTTPVKQLKSGGLGVNAIRQLAASLDVSADEAARLMELLHLAGLTRDTWTSHRKGRKETFDSFVEPTEAAAAWLEQPAPARWRQLAAAWLRTAHWPSASGRKGDDGKVAVPVFTHQAAGASAPRRRSEVLQALAHLDGDHGSADGQSMPATSPDALAAWLYWQRPHPWLGYPRADPATLVGWIYAEAELLGVAASGRLSSFGRALLDGSGDRAEELFAAAAPAESSSFTVQADLTAVAAGRLARDVLAELRLVADVESTGAATTFRFSEASLRRAIDAGRDGEAILSFLRQHSEKTVPKALEYLATDVARRHGQLRVGAAQSFVTADDPAVLADACSHRRTRKLALRLLAPTVAVSHQDPGTVLQSLRDAGFLPAPVDGNTSSDAVDAGRSDAGLNNVIPLRARRGRDEPIGLPEPFRQMGSPTQGARELTPDQAASLAVGIMEGRPEELTFDIPDEALEVGFDDDLDDLDDVPLLDTDEALVVFDRAIKTGDPLGLVVADGDDADVVFLQVQAVTKFGPRGLDLIENETRTIDWDDLIGLLDPGPVGARGGRR